MPKHKHVEVYACRNSFFPGQKAVFVFVIHTFMRLQKSIHINGDNINRKYLLCMDKMFLFSMLMSLFLGAA